MEKSFPRRIGALDDIFLFTQGFFQRAGIDRRHLEAVNLAVEELFTNMIKYNQTTGNRIVLGLQLSGNRLVIHLTDTDVEPFDVTRAKEPQVDLPLAERQPGGLGLHLVRKLMDTVEYTYEDRQSRITLTKGVG